MAVRVRSRAPGRVNLIGDHTDYTGGLVMPMAIDRATTVDLEPGGDEVFLTSGERTEPAVVPIDIENPAEAGSGWARYVAGVVAAIRPERGGTGTVSTTVPLGAGLSSSASLEVALALALGFRGTAIEVALACQRAEELAWGVATGVMDQLASAAGRAGHALLIDCTSLDVIAVPVPPDVQVIVADSGQRRTVAQSAYAQRRRECDQAAEAVGPLREASPGQLSAIADPLLVRRARHVVTENARVSQFAQALAAADLAEAGALMQASHASLRDDFEVSTPALDSLVEDLVATPGVYGARLTGAGFGGCVVALADPGSPAAGWRLHASDGAAVEEP